MQSMKIIGILLVLVSVAPNRLPETRASPQQATEIPGTRISLIPPDEFSLSPRFPGYWLESFASSIIVTEFPGPFSELISGFSDASSLSQRGMSVLSRRSVTVGQHKGELLNIEQRTLGTDYLKWLLIFGDDKEAVIIAATCPKEFEKLLSEKLKASVLTAKWHKERAVSLLEGLNFTIREKGGMKVAKRIANSLNYTKSGVFPSKVLDDPFFIVGQTLSAVMINDQKEFAKVRVSQTATITAIEIHESSDIVIDSVAGIEILANGKDLESGQAMVLYQVLLFEDQSYYIMQGIVSQKYGADYLPVFKEMAKSFRRAN